MFDIANISVEVMILLLRIAVIVLLYFFLWRVLRVVIQDLRHSATQPVQSTNPYGQLVIVSSGQTGLPVGKNFPLHPLTMMGRSLDCEVSLNDSFLSSQHARMELRGDEWVVEDMGSTNGTFVNGFEVRDATSFNEGDILRIGRIELKLVR